MSNSLWACGPQPIRLPCPWDSPGKNTGVGCHVLLQGIFLTQESNHVLLPCRQSLYQLSYQESPVLVAQSCPTLCDLMDCSLPGSSVHGIFQAWILDWVAISYSRGYSQLRDQIAISCISCIGRRILYHCATSEAHVQLTYSSVLSRYSVHCLYHLFILTHSLLSLSDMFHTLSCSLNFMIHHFNNILNFFLCFFLIAFTWKCPQFISAWLSNFFLFSLH